jgi:RNA polymerase sigma factor (sigma-70 family)
MLRRIAASYEADRQKREELLQDILAAVWQALPSFRGDSSVRTFLARIAQNRAISHVARAAAEPRSTVLDEGLPAEELSPQEQAEQSEQQRWLMNAVRNLPLSVREPVILTLEGFTPKEIAAVLNLNPNIISIRLTRAKEMLRQILAKEPTLNRD